jgi:hypothetical protein
MDYLLDRTSPVRISISLPSGRVVEEFDQGTQDKGFHSWVWNVPPGEHAVLVRLQANGTSTSKLAIVP